MNLSGKTLTIGKLARAAGVGVDTVRFYERAGLLPSAVRSASGYRHYDIADADRLHFIRRAKNLGFTLEEVAELLSLSTGKGSRREVKALAERRLAGLDVKIRELTAVRDALAHHASQCSGLGPVPGCPIIEAVLAATPDRSKPCMHNTPTTTPAAKRKRSR